MDANHIDSRGNIHIRQGDTMDIAFIIGGAVNTERVRTDRVVFGVTDGLTGARLLRQVAEIGADGRARLSLTNAATKKLPVGLHRYDARYIQDANADATDGRRVFTPFVRYFEVLEIASEV